jgi:hypothetical protein
MSRLRLIPTGATLLWAAVWGLLAVANYPIVVIADSPPFESEMKH